MTFFLFVSHYLHGQSADDYFNMSANHYIDGNKSIALNTLDRGIKTYPNDEYLPLLKKRILGEEQQDQENNQDEGEQNEEDQENEESQDQDQESQEEQEGEEGQEESEEQKEGEEQEQQQQNEESDEEGKESKEQPSPSTQQKLEDMNISEEKARMILEAMQNNEIQYIQQQRRKPTKAQDTGKPDW